MDNSTAPFTQEELAEFFAELRDTIAIVDASDLEKSNELNALSKRYNLGLQFSIRPGRRGTSYRVDLSPEQIAANEKKLSGL